MYGMVNQAIEAMVTEKFGRADWEKVKEIMFSGKNPELKKDFEDKVTKLLIRFLITG